VKRGAVARLGVFLLGDTLLHLTTRFGHIMNRCAPSAIQSNCP
jgi:hypothetical protein